MLQKAAVRGGVLTADHSTFLTRLTVSDKAAFSDSIVKKGIYFKRPVSGYSVLELDNSEVYGDIVFKDGGGLVLTKNSKIHGKVIGGKVRTYS